MVFACIKAIPGEEREVTREKILMFTPLNNTKENSVKTYKTGL
jgi:hypothetical protein